MDEKELNFEETCRACGTQLTLQEMLPLFKTAENYEAVSSDIIYLLDILKFNINKDDGLPQQICMNCVDSFSAIDEFYKGCKQMQSVLWSLYLKNEIEEDVDINEDIPPDPLQIDTEEVFEGEFTEEMETAGITTGKANVCDVPVSPEPDSSSLNVDDIYGSQRKSEPTVSKEKSKKKARRRIIDTTKKKPFLSYRVITQCKFCKKSFNNVIVHQRKCPERNVEICSYCDMEVKNTDELNKHIDEKHPHQLPACSICSIDFSTFRERRVHRLAVHDRFHCKFCDRDFPDKQGVDVHTRRMHGEKIDKSCPICQKAFTSQFKYDYHIATHDPAKLKYQCQFCEKRFHKRHHCEDHQRRHIGVRPYLCEVCGNAFKDSIVLENHRKSHYDIPKLKRDRKFTSPSYPKKNKSLMECPVDCGRRFKPSSLQKHLETCHPLNELGEKVYPYTCPVCSQGFTGTNSLALHIKCHSENRPYQCQICGSEFKRSQHLASHMRCIHTKEKKFSCEHCNKSFTEKHQLNAHIVIHSDARNHKCPTCPAAFKSKAGFRMHWRLHTGEKPYVCMLCRKSFPRVGDLHLHHLKHTDLEREKMGQLIVEQLDENTLPSKVTELSEDQR